MQPNKRGIMRCRVANNDSKMLIPAQFGAEHHHFGIRGAAQGYIGACGDLQALCGGGDILVDIAHFDHHDPVLVTQFFVNGRIPCWQTGHQCGRHQLGNTQQPRRIVGKRSLALGNNRQLLVKQSGRWLANSKRRQTILGQIMR